MDGVGREGGRREEKRKGGMEGGREEGRESLNLSSCIRYVLNDSQYTFLFATKYLQH